MIKVDRVTAVAEAEALQSAGATVIGLDLAEDPRFNDGRHVSVEIGHEIRAALTDARLCVTLDANANDPEAALDAVRGLRPDFLQVPRVGPARTDWRDAILGVGIPVIFDGEEASYEDDPGWVASAIEDAVAWGASLVQLDVLNDMGDPWPFLTVRALEDPDELLQVSDIIDLTRRFPLLLTIEGTPDEFRSFCESFPSARGFFTRLIPGRVGPTIDRLAALRTSRQRPAVDRV